MPLLIDRIQTKRFISLFVGRSGTGKTVAEASFPKPLHIDDFDGRVGGAQVPWLDMKGIDYDYYPPKMPGLLQKLNEKLELLLGAAKLSMPGIVSLPQTYVCDSVTNEAYAFLSTAISLSHIGKNNQGHEIKKGTWFGPIGVEGPGDYKLEATGVYDYLAFLKSIPIPNVIMSAHYVDRYGKPEPAPGAEPNPYADSVVIGKKLSIRDKIGENIQTSFDHIFEFERDVNRYFVIFRGELARTSFSWLPDGKHEWTGKNFYEFMMSFNKKGETV